MTRDFFRQPPPCAAICMAVAVACGCDDSSSEGGSDPGRSTSTDPETQLDADMARIVATQKISGLAAAVVRGEEIVFSEGYGFADIEAGVPATADTPFTIASVSKTFIAVAMMQAVETGTVTLDTPVNDTGLPFELDNPHLSDEVITLRHLATHTSGLRDGDAYDCSYYIEEDESPLFALVDPSIECASPLPTELGDYLAAYVPTDGVYYDEANYSSDELGTKWSYSNVGAALAAYALQSATGTDFAELCENGIFGPLGMTNTHWHRSQFENTDVAAQYTVLDTGRIRIPNYSLATWPDGGLRTSANDLARYAGAIMNGGEWDGTRILDEDTVEVMLSPQTTATVTEAGTDEQGIFWIHGFGYYGHTGGDPGASSAVFLDPAERVAAVFVANQDFDDDVYNALLVKLLEFAASTAE